MGTDDTRAVDTTGLTTDQLERIKLEWEIEKTRAEAEKADIETARLRHDYEWGMARPSNWADGLEYTFNEPVYADTVGQCITTLNIWTRKWPGAPITMVINSPGGSIFDGLALFDYLRGLRARGHHITTRSIGMAASMAGVLMQAGDTRQMGSYSYVLIHEASTLAIGKSSAIEDEWKLLTRLQDRLVDILQERSTLSAETIKHNWQRKDWWLDAHECLELGLADEIV